MGVDLLIVARTDALSASFIDSNIDTLDQPFILGCVDVNNKEKLLTFPEAGRVSIMEMFRGEERENMMKMWNSVCYSISLKEALKIARESKFEFYFDWDACRTDEGYYMVEGSVTYCI
jgi:isocitrate lyase